MVTLLVMPAAAPQRNLATGLWEYFDVERWGWWGGGGGGRGGGSSCCLLYSNNNQRAMFLYYQGCTVPEVEGLLSECGTCQTAGQPWDPPAAAWAANLGEERGGEGWGREGEGWGGKGRGGEGRGGKGREGREGVGRGEERCGEGSVGRERWGGR